MGNDQFFMGERQSSVLVLLKKSLRSRVINESLCKLRGLIMLLLGKYCELKTKYIGDVNMYK